MLVMSDVDTLREINEAIAQAETAGDRDWLAARLGPALAFRRASGAIDDRAAFLAKVNPSAARTTQITSIELVGKTRALVRAIVSLSDASGTARYDNLRLFVRTPDGPWQLIAWANEELPALRDPAR